MDIRMLAIGILVLEYPTIILTRKRIFQSCTPRIKQRRFLACTYLQWKHTRFKVSLLISNAYKQLLISNKPYTVYFTRREGRNRRIFPFLERNSQNAIWIWLRNDRTPTYVHCFHKIAVTKRRGVRDCPARVIDSVSTPRHISSKILFCEKETCWVIRGSIWERDVKNVVE